MALLKGQIASHNRNAFSESKQLSGAQTSLLWKTDKTINQAILRSSLSSKSISSVQSPSKKRIKKPDRVYILLYFLSSLNISSTEVGRFLCRFGQSNSVRSRQTAASQSNQNWSHCCRTFRPGLGHFRPVWYSRQPISAATLNIESMYRRSLTIVLVLSLSFSTTVYMICSYCDCSKFSDFSDASGLSHCLLRAE